MVDKVRDRRERIYAKTNGCCWYCGTVLVLNSATTRPETACIDHIIPKSQGGSNALHNLLPSCWLCNSRKHKKTLEEYRAYLGQKRAGVYRAIGLLREALAECSTPYDASLIEAITWLENQAEAVVFWGEK